MKYLNRVKRLTKKQQTWDAMKEERKKGTKRPGSFNK